jgi:hypothetical protein
MVQFTATIIEMRLKLFDVGADLRTSRRSSRLNTDGKKIVIKPHIKTKNLKSKQ